MIDVTVIDDSDYVGWAASATRVNEVYMTDVKSMIKNVINAVGYKSIGRLNILDHGNKEGMQIGTDWINSRSLSDFEFQFKILATYFSPNGSIHLQHCDIGQNKNLLLAIAKLFRVPVFAGTGKHNPVYRFNFGDYVRCGPSGKCLEGVQRP